MSEIYKIRIVLDTTEDVIRDVFILPGDKLESLHQIIVRGFDLDEGELSTYFMSNEDWDQGKEVSLFGFGLEGETEQNMSEVSVSQVLNKIGSRGLYVYDFLHLWTFYIELIQIGQNPNINIEELPKVVSQLGDRPKEAPAKEMEGNEENGFSDDLSDDSEMDFDDEGYFS